MPTKREEKKEPTHDPTPRPTPAFGSPRRCGTPAARPIRLRKTPIGRSVHTPIDAHEDPGSHEDRAEGEGKRRWTLCLPLPFRRTDRSCPRSWTPSCP
eukprot:scaffold47_cov334-Pavlova_lutheri.AAC.26